MPGNNKLVIYPLEPGYKLAHPDRFLARLVNIGFATENATAGDSKEALLPGDLFMKHLVFLGCSPSIGSGAEGMSFNRYTMELVTSNKTPALIVSERLRVPECPACGYRDNNGRARNQIRMDPAIPTWSCVKCGRQFAVADINWRHKLAIATDFIVVHGVFEGEVVPSDKFLDQLTGESGIAWSYCYC